MLVVLLAIGPANEAEVGPERRTARTTSATVPTVSETRTSHIVQHGAGDHLRRPEVDVLGGAVSVTGGSSSDAERAQQALAGFERAGLTLPPVEIVFHEDRAGCSGHHGLFETQYEPWRLSVCDDFPYVVTHELAHAWEAARLTDPDRERYLAHRGLDVWLAADVPWGERGIEDAAFIVQQNLTATRADLQSSRWIERVDAYEVLTGRRSPLRIEEPSPDRAADRWTTASASSVV